MHTYDKYLLMHLYMYNRQVRFFFKIVSITIANKNTNILKAKTFLIILKGHCKSKNFKVNIKNIFKL